MSKQLKLSATLSIMAMAALVAGMGIGGPESGGSARAATAQGSLVSVLLRA